MDVSSAISCSVTTDHLFICHSSSKNAQPQASQGAELQCDSWCEDAFPRERVRHLVDSTLDVKHFFKNEVHNIYYQPNIFVIYQISKLCGTSALGYSLWDQTWFTSIVFLISLVHEHFFISELELLLLLLKPSQTTSLILSQL